MTHTGYLRVRGKKLREDVAYSRSGIVNLNAFMPKGVRTARPNNLCDVDRTALDYAATPARDK